MADIAINKSNAKRYLNGSIPPSSPNTIDGEPVPPSSIIGGGEWVPYLGAKDDVDLGEYFLKASHLKLKTDLATIPTDQGSIYWDEDEETIAVILNGSTTKVGEDIFFQVKNQSGATIPKGTAVRFDGVVGASGRVKIVPFIANGSNPSIYFLGVTYEAIANGADGKALFNGKIRGVNTSAFAVGDILYASPTVAGGFTTTKPVAPNNIISVAAVLSSGANGILLIRPQIGSNINNDEGVKITTPTTGDILQLQASGLWENKSRLEAGLIAGSGTTNYLAKFTASGTVGRTIGIFESAEGNMGIGTINPDYLLDVANNFRFSNTAQGSLSGFYTCSNTGEITLNFGGTTTPDKGRITYSGFSDAFSFSTNSTERMRITSDGNVGIGTISPGTKLHVLANSAADEGNAAAIIRQGGGNNNNGLLVDVTNSVNAYIADFRQGNLSLMRFTGSGNLLINTTTDAGFKLDVNGSLRANTRVNFASLPTSSSGLVSGDLWRNGTVINIIP